MAETPVPEVFADPPAPVEPVPVEPPPPAAPTGPTVLVLLGYDGEGAMLLRHDAIDADKEYFIGAREVHISGEPYVQVAESDGAKVYAHRDSKRR